ncbi:MAG: O-antigen ligase family protein [Caldilineaceae bacterium]
MSSISRLLEPVKLDGRSVLALLRLLLLYAIFCGWMVAAGLTLRSWYELPQTIATPAVNKSRIGDLPYLGIAVQLEGQSPQEQQASLQRLHQSDLGWVRQRVDWGQVETTPGHYDWRQTDGWIDVILANQLLPVFVLDGSPAWSRRPEDQTPTDNSLAPPADPTDFARFAQAFAQRYGDRLRYYQLWDEPNIAPHWGNRWIDPVEYSQLLSAASRAIRQTDPDAVILTAALAPTADRGQLANDEIYFLQRMIASGAAPWFDVVAIQPFGFGYAPSDSRQVLQRLNFQRAALIRRALVNNGLGDKPLWAVRFGWNRQIGSPWATVSAADQMHYAQEAIQLARQSWPWLVALGWAIDRPKAALDDPMWGFVVEDGQLGRWGDREKYVQDRRCGCKPHIDEDVESVRLQTAPTASCQVLQTQLVWTFVLLFVTLALIVWRVVAAIHSLPWQQLRQMHRPIYLALWLLTIVVYYFATWPPLIGFCWLLAAGLIALFPPVGLYLAALTLPFYFQHKEIALVDTILTIPPSLAATLCLLPAIFYHLFSHLRLSITQSAIRNSQSAIHLFALTWLLLNLLSAINAWNKSAYAVGLLELAVQPLLLYLAVRLFVRSEQERYRLVAALVIGASLAASSGLIAWLRGTGVDADGVLRLAGPFFSPNHAALVFTRGLFLGIGLLIVDRPRQLWWGLLIAVLGVALLLTASRGALLLGLPAGVSVLALYRLQLRHAGIEDKNLTKRRKARRGFMLLCGFAPFREFTNSLDSSIPFRVFRAFRGSRLALFALIVFMLGASGVWFGWQRLANSATLLSRLETWRATFELWRHFPLLGVGPEGYFWNYPAFLPASALSESKLLHPHNLWLEFAAQWGTLGLIWLGCLFWFLWRTRPVHSWLQIAMLAALLAALAHAQVDAFMSLPDLAAWNWLVLGLWSREHKKTGRQEDRKTGRWTELNLLVFLSSCLLLQVHLYIHIRCGRKRKDLFVDQLGDVCILK